jgi:uncharacterized membrane protein (Fun14 family)
MCATLATVDASPLPVDLLAASADDPVNTGTQMALSMGPPATFGGACGFVSGFVAMKVGKTAVFAVGVVFVGLQGLSKLGFIEVRWDKLESLYRQQRDLLQKDGVSLEFGHLDCFLRPSRPSWIMC